MKYLHIYLLDQFFVINILHIFTHISRTFECLSLYFCC